MFRTKNNLSRSVFALGAALLFFSSASIAFGKNLDQESVQERPPNKLSQDYTMGDAVCVAINGSEEFQEAGLSCPSSRVFHASVPEWVWTNPLGWAIGLYSDLFEDAFYVEVFLPMFGHGQNFRAQCQPTFWMEDGDELGVGMIVSLCKIYDLAGNRVKKLNDLEIYDLQAPFFAPGKTIAKDWHYDWEFF